MLTIENLSVNYGQSQILNDVALRIEPAQVVCLLGRNGVGKTTLLKTIMGLLRPRTGRVIFDLAGCDQPCRPTGAPGPGSAIFPQGRGIFPYLTVQENLLMGFERTHARSADILEEMYAQFPVLKTMARRTAGILSGGQQQQLAIARALVGKPRLLLLGRADRGHSAIDRRRDPGGDRPACASAAMWRSCWSSSFSISR